MTFLIFLVSVAVLEYILKRSDRDAKNLPGNTEEARKHKTETPAVGTAGLHNLGQVLEQHGRGALPAVRSTELQVKDKTGA